MNRRSLVLMVVTALAAGTAAFASPTLAKWPPWLSIESPVNPYDPSARGALLLVHATFREGPSQLSDLAGSAEGIVGGARKSVALRFDTTGRPDVYALRRQWPAEGRWILKLSLRTTTALVALDTAGNVASVQLPTQLTATGDRVPRPVSAHDVDAALASVASR
ncbi:MAG TPA: hypothetical protein VE967_01145 [Gemmatimonadaceae bacterium]|nr:hypothetical protein [Gemmatimonadaceae bacterium]